jgi:hypothetical protein
VNFTSAEFDLKVSAIKIVAADIKLVLIVSSRSSANIFRRANNFERLYVTFACAVIRNHLKTVLLHFLGNNFKFTERFHIFLYFPAYKYSRATGASSKMAKKCTICCDLTCLHIAFSKLFELRVLHKKLLRLFFAFVLVPFSLFSERRMYKKDNKKNSC